MVVGGAFLALRAAAVRDVRRVFLGELARNQQAWRTLQEERLHLLLAASSLVSTSPTLRAALQTARTEQNAGLSPRPDLLATVRRETEQVFGDLDRDLLVVTDDAGRVLAAVAREGIPWTSRDVSGLPPVRHALVAEVPVVDSSFGLVRAGGVTLQVGSAAIIVQGYPVGVLLLGDRLERVIPRTDTATGSELVVTAGEEILLASAGLQLDSIMRSGLRALAADLGPHPVELGGAEFLAVTLPLGITQDGHPAAVHLLRSLQGTLGPLDRALSRSFLVAGLLAVILVGIGAMVVSRSLLAPLSRFVRHLEEGSRRPALLPFAERHASVELRTLSDAYNGLIDSLTRQHEELRRANQELRTQIVERERAEEALRESEAQLRQSQKLEALGRLAGGVAHDFNNLLTVIGLSTQLLREELQVGNPHRHELDQIDGAAERAKSLVQQLLAFSRKQVMQPRLVVVNEVVRGLEPLLRRLLGSRVTCETRLADELAPILADPGQLEQIVMNLAVNASDAMPQGGRFVIETAGVILDKAYESRPDAVPGGPAVMLAVSDSGTGMDPETRSRIFEPFFTTKPPGKGTGLGLSTVYGIVRQSHGSITVFSEPGKGTTMRIYFPVAATDLDSGSAEAAGSGRGLSVRE